MSKDITFREWQEIVMVELMRRKMTKSDLAKAIGLHRDTVYKALSGFRPSPEVKQKILEYLEIR